MPATRSLPRFAIRSVGYSQLAFWSSIAGALMAVFYVPPGSLRTFVITTPTLTVALCVAATFWLYEACDEFQRARILRAAARTAALMSAVTLLWFFLELLGFQKLSMLWVNIVGWGLFNAQVLYVVLRQ